MSLNFWIQGSQKVVYNPFVMNLYPSIYKTGYEHKEVSKIRVILKVFVLPVIQAVSICVILYHYDTSITIDFKSFQMQMFFTLLIFMQLKLIMEGQNLQKFFAVYMPINIGICIGILIFTDMVFDSGQFQSLNFLLNQENVVIIIFCIIIGLGFEYLMGAFILYNFPLKYQYWG